MRVNLSRILSQNLTWASQGCVTVYPATFNGYSVLVLSADSPDEPDGQSHQQDDPPEVTQLPRGHLRETIRAGKDQHQGHQDGDHGGDLQTGSLTGRHGRLEWSSTGPSGSKSPAPVRLASAGTTSGDLPFQRSTSCRRRNAGFTFKASPRIW